MFAAGILNTKKGEKEKEKERKEKGEKGERKRKRVHFQVQGSNQSERFYTTLFVSATAMSTITAHFP